MSKSFEDFCKERNQKHDCVDLGECLACELDWYKQRCEELETDMESYRKRVESDAFDFHKAKIEELEAENKQLKEKIEEMKRIEICKHADELSDVCQLVNFVPIKCPCEHWELKK
jgi:predicted RNase H-like nuclease (RuvC/YqgF family)